METLQIPSSALVPAHLIGSGAQAEVFLYDGCAVKVFRQDYPASEALAEAQKQERASLAGLPAPEVYGTATVDGRTALVMAYIKGDPLGELMLAQSTHVPELMREAVELQLKMHRSTGWGYPSLRERLARQISRTGHLADDSRAALLAQLDTLPEGNRLCHGDLHVLNIIRTPEGPVALDWGNACSGPPAADACRTYLLYLLYREEFAPVYLKTYCREAGIEPERVTQWLPVVAGARFDEPGRGGDLYILDRLTGK